MNDYKSTILIIENQQNKLSYLANLLVKEGYSLETSFSLESVQESVQQLDIDLFIINKELPFINCYDLAKNLRQESKTKKTPIIFSIDLGSSLEREEIFAIENCDYIIKPWQKDEILTKINNQLKLKKQSQTKIKPKEEGKENQQIANLSPQAKGELLANMSHELRTPLNAIIGFSQLLISDQSLTPEQQEYAGIIERNGNYLSSLINNILEISALEAGKVTINQSIFDFSEFIDVLEEIPQITAISKGLKFNFELDTNLPQQIYTDKAKLRQVLTSLLNYAIDCTEEGEICLKVSSRANQDKQLINFEISDTSYGMTPEELEQLFLSSELKPFTEEGEMQKNLVLLVTQQIALLLGGEIRVTSEIGKGNVFSFEISVEDSSTTEPISTTASSISSLSGEELSLMPKEWIKDLYEAALSVDDQQILTLVEQIPETETNLTQLITNVVNNFRLDILVEVIEELTIDN